MITIDNYLQLLDDNYRVTVCYRTSEDRHIILCKSEICNVDLYESIKDRLITSLYHFVDIDDGVTIVISD